MKRRIGILTGGGDVPGLNPVIKSVVYRSTELGYEVLGIRRGWQGLTHMRPGREPDPEYIRPLDRANTRAIDRTGGTILHTSRTNPRKMAEARLPAFLDATERGRLAAGHGMYDLTPLVLRNIASLGLDYLVTIGGDDTLSYSEVLVGEGIPIIAVPKTMDNDDRMSRVAGCEPTATLLWRAGFGLEGRAIGDALVIDVADVFGVTCPRRSQGEVACAHGLRLDSAQQLHIALPARGAIVRSTARGGTSFHRSDGNGAIAEVGDRVSRSPAGSSTGRRRAVGSGVTPGRSATVRPSLR